MSEIVQERTMRRHSPNEFVCFHHVNDAADSLVDVEHGEVLTNHATPARGAKHNSGRPGGLLRLQTLLLADLVDGGNARGLDLKLRDCAIITESANHHAQAARAENESIYNPAAC